MRSSSLGIAVCLSALVAASGNSLAVADITPVSGVLVGINPGHTVVFRKGVSGAISNADSVASAQQLFALAASDPSVVAIATDNGVAVINYLDAGGGNDFPNPRDIGVGPLTAVKTTGAAGSQNSGTFNPQATDNDFAMESSGYIFIPSAGLWTFLVKSDDGFLLTMGANNAVVGEFNGGRGAEYNDTAGDSVANVPAPGYYPYNLLYYQGGGGAMVQFTATPGSFPSPFSLPPGSELVGDTANGGLSVYQSFVQPGVVVASGDQVPGETPGTHYVSFGVASLDGNQIGFSASIKPQIFSAEQAIIGGPALDALVHVGDPAPGVTNATFFSFKDPVFAGGHFAFVGTMTPGFVGVTKANATGLWSNAFGTLGLVAREGDPAPGVEGATFLSFVSVALPPTGGSIFVAMLVGPSARKSLSLWRETTVGPALVLQQGSQVDLGFGPRRVVNTFAALPAVTGSPDQKRFSSGGSLPVRVQFTDGLQALLMAPGDGSALEVAAFRGSGPESPTGSEFKSFGLPSESDSGFAFLAGLLPKIGGVATSNATAIFAGPLGGFMAQVRQGDDPPGTTTSPPLDKFLSFDDPAFVGAGTYAFIGKLAPGGDVTAANASGIWTNAQGSLQLVARQGGPVPGVTGAKFLSFTSLTLPDTTPARGPVFVAKLAVGPGGVTAASNVGLWATDSTGSTSLIVRTGDMVQVHSAMKKVSVINVLNAVSESPGQPRAVNGFGVLLYVLQFTDRTQAVCQALIP